ncbi:hypothetical protein Patl1_22566 [Pistacia atlantica]|uniref:Uncharacterized protein n=1 Tax=Pistacia atlantica TaxID=434234 RepID=A0ACC1A0V1_9ROSI|nr:hypothetical protein Patl1_22566 [Pistacia atlantica]
MGTRSLDIALISAYDLKNVNVLSNMHVYAVATFSGESQTTSVHRDCGVKPNWNHRMRFTVDEASLSQNNLHITYSVKASRGCFGDSDLGKVHVSIQEMLAQSNNGLEEKNMTYNITTPGGRSKGYLNVSFKFSPALPTPTMAVAPIYDTPPPGMSYPPPGTAGAGGYPLPDHHAESNSPYPPPAQGGYPPPPPPQLMAAPPAPTTASSPIYDTPPPGMSYPPPGTVGAGSYPPPDHHVGSNSPYPPPSQRGYPPPDNHHDGVNSAHPPPDKGVYPPPDQHGGYLPPDQHGGYPLPQSSSPIPPPNSCYSSTAGFLQLTPTAPRGQGMECSHKALHPFHPLTHVIHHRQDSYNCCRRRLRRWGMEVLHNLRFHRRHPQVGIITRHRVQGLVECQHMEIIMVDRLRHRNKRAVAVVVVWVWRPSGTRNGSRSVGRAGCCKYDGLGFGLRLKEWIDNRGILI